MTSIGAIHLPARPGIPAIHKMMPDMVAQTGLSRPLLRLAVLCAGTFHPKRLSERRVLAGFRDS